MTKIVNDPEAFPKESLRGFVDAYSEYVQAVHGGVVRSTASPESEVALVVGGGSGHYPAFAGWVGPGIAHGSVCGNIFSSPSASQARSVIRAADNGAGTLMMFGNYAGDVLHFGQAAEQLRAENIDVRIVTITDDIASNTADKHLERRGIAGDFPVVKIVGAACAEGLDLDAAEAVARHANDRTRTLGVAFSGCTLPGASEPLFEVEKGTFGLGLGIHGEPGIATEELGTADDLAEMLVNKVLAEEPARGEDGYEGRVAVLVNGLGATKYEELFLLYGTIAKLLREAGLTIVRPVVDEQVTSLDMAGVSLTLTFLDEDLERYWVAAADTPAFRSGSVDRSSEAKREVAAEEESAIPAGSEASAKQAAAFAAIFEELEKAARGAERELGKMDSVAGDGDHGQGMTLGTTAAAASARESVEAGAGVKTLLARAGAAWSEGAGGTAGALWGGALARVGTGLSDDVVVDDDAIRLAVIAGAESVLEMGGAQVGDKTMVDAIVPFAESLRAAEGTDLAAAWAEAAGIAEDAAKGTAEFAAKKGRARTHGDVSVGTPDPGATSFALLMRTIADQLG
ncbi:dihydroxyacetone kinase family protein [Actinomycetaceae bacterium L2_0104]